MDITDIATHLLAWLSADPASATLHGAPGLVQADPIATPVPLQDVQVNTVGQQSGLTADDFSYLNLFLKADIVGKSVIIILIVASFWSWAIAIEKWLRYNTLARKADRFENIFWSGKSLDDLYQQVATRADHPMATVFVAAMREWRRSFEAGALNAQLLPSIKQRLDRVMSVTISRELGTAERHLGFLATVGTTAPFIGLFGTVWGIMNSFRMIAGTQSTGLDVVAPGLAEALFATALGLAAAIPAVVLYNNLSTSLSRYAQRLEGFADEFSAILSRQLDERAR